MSTTPQRGKVLKRPTPSPYTPPGGRPATPSSRLSEPPSSPLQPTTTRASVPLAQPENSGETVTKPADPSVPVDEHEQDSVRPSIEQVDQQPTQPDPVAADPSTLNQRPTTPPAWVPTWDNSLTRLQESDWADPFEAIGMQAPPGFLPLRNPALGDDPLYSHRGRLEVIATGQTERFAHLDQIHPQGTPTKRPSITERAHQEPGRSKVTNKGHITKPGATLDTEMENLDATLTGSRRGDEPSSDVEVLQALQTAAGDPEVPVRVRSVTPTTHITQDQPPPEGPIQTTQGLPPTEVGTQITQDLPPTEVATDTAQALSPTEVATDTTQPPPPTEPTAPTTQAQTTRKPPQAAANSPRVTRAKSATRKQKD